MIHLLPCGAKDEFVMLWWQTYTLPFRFYVCYNKLLCCSWRVTQLDFLTTCWFMDQPHILETYFTHSMIWIVSEQEARTWVWWHVKPHEEMGRQIIWLKCDLKEKYYGYGILCSWCEFGTSECSVWWSATNVVLQTCTFWRSDLEPQDHENLVLDTVGGILTTHLILLGAS